MRSLAVMIACLAMGSASLAADEAAQFRYSRQVDRGKARGEDIVAFSLDGEIYAATRDGLPDLRVLDGDHVAAPYQTEPNVEYFEERSRQTFPTEVTSLREEDGAVEIRLQLPREEPPAEGFSFSTPLSNYERKVRIFGSSDGVDWKPLAADGVVFDYSRYMDVSNHDIPLPANAFRRFKIIVENMTDEKESPYKELARTFHGNQEDQRVERIEVERRPFRIDRITAWHTVARQHVRRNKTVVHAVAAFTVEQDAAQKQTIVHVHTRREPLTGFVLETPTGNFSRRAVVEAPEVRGVTTRWRPVGEAIVSSFRFRSFHRDQLAVSFPEGRQEEYRIIIHNEDNPPLDIRGVKAEGTDYRVVFLAQPSKTYCVYYGSESAKTPQYEAAAVLATLQRDYQPVEARLGPQTKNPAFGGEPGPSVAKVLNNWIFLGAAIGLMVVVLAWGLFRAGKRLEQLPKE
jgi:hypothetical protein